MLWPQRLWHTGGRGEPAVRYGDITEPLASIFIFRWLSAVCVLRTTFCYLGTLASRATVSSCGRQRIENSSHSRGQMFRYHMLFLCWLRSDAEFNELKWHTLLVKTNLKICSVILKGWYLPSSFFTGWCVDLSSDDNSEESESFQHSRNGHKGTRHPSSTHRRPRANRVKRIRGNNVRNWVTKSFDPIWQSIHIFLIYPSPHSPLGFSAVLLWVDGGAGDRETTLRGNTVCSQKGLLWSARTINGAVRDYNPIT